MHIGYEVVKMKDFSGFFGFYGVVLRDRLPPENTLLIPQCETVGFLKHIEEIVKIDGVDGIFLGPYDLTTDMGIPEQFTNPDFLKARTRILRACKDAGKFAWIFSPNSTVAKKNLADGFDGTAVSIDTVIYIDAFKALVNEIRNS
jgi:4-hydroxy-2-oxoheptanedioate aldolase